MTRLYKKCINRIICTSVRFMYLYYHAQTCMSIGFRRFMANLSVRLKQLKNERNLLQKDIANAIGISLRAYQYYESGERKPDIDILEKLADYFEVSSDYLLSRTDNPETR